MVLSKPDRNPRESYTSMQDPKTGLGLVQIYTGESKGKTTAALGLALRARGQGFRVHVLQFLKGASNCGEHKFVREFHAFEIEQPVGEGSHFRHEDKRHVQAQRTLERAREILPSGDYDIVILDEAVGAVAKGYIDEAEFVDLIENRPAGTEVVLTGRGATPALIEIADYVTELKKVKHPMDRGIRARRGIEF